MQKFLSIRTTRYSEFFRRLLQQYREGVRVEVDGARYSEADLDSLIESWCTNAKIRATRNFSLWRGETELFGFHDSPDELWAADSESAFIESLEREHLLRVRHFRPRERRSIWSCIKSWFSA
jgi:hypothetical protein